MPTYEMPLLLRAMKKSDCAATLKRVTEAIFKTGGVIRKIENLGNRELPYKISAHGSTHRQANHFLLFFDVPPATIESLSDECSRDMDIIRSKIYKQIVPCDTSCTFHEEMLPPVYRPDVQKLLDIAKRQRSTKYNFKYNSGLDYYPFQR